MRSLTVIEMLTGVGLAIAASCAQAQELRVFDMSQVPLQEINLQGGSFIARLLENEVPYRSQLVLECTDCATQNDALVGLVADTAGEGADFARAPQGFIVEMSAVCRQQAESCAFERASLGGLPGYSYVARYADGFAAVEHVYFSNGLTFVINAGSNSEADAKANVAALIDVTSPYVIGAPQ